MEGLTLKLKVLRTHSHTLTSHTHVYLTHTHLPHTYTDILYVTHIDNTFSFPVFHVTSAR